MISKAASEVFLQGLSVLSKDISSETSKTKAVLKAIATYPIKVLATYITAPFLVVRIALFVKNPIRRVFAIVGLLLSMLVAFIAGTFLGSVVGAFFVATHIGPVAGLGVFLGTTMSIYLTVAFQIVIFNFVSFVFLKISTDDVVAHLNKISK